MGVTWTFCLGWSWTTILLISLSQVPKITGVSHCAWPNFCSSEASVVLLVLILAAVLEKQPELQPPLTFFHKLLSNYYCYCPIYPAHSGIFLDSSLFFTLQISPILMIYRVCICNFACLVKLVTPIRHSWNFHGSRQTRTEHQKLWVAQLIHSQLRLYKEIFCLLVSSFTL
jgi:hypothetical protein